MNKNSLLKYVKQDYLLIALLVLSLFSLLRSLIVPLQGDEITYFKIGEHILSGKYYLQDYPSTVTPVLPFFFALFHTPFYPPLGFGLMRCFSILLAVFGLKYMCLFLKKQNVSHLIILSILILTITNNHSIAWFSSLYPESILFFSFWGFVYYFSQKVSVSNFRKTLFFFVLLVMTRYLFAILGVTILFYYYRCYKTETITNWQLKQIGFYTLIFAIPVLFWFKYVYYIEQSNLSEISYFTRFKDDNSGLLYNIKSGLGLIKHAEVNRINGIPAFVNLFVPITGLRHYLISVVLLVLVILGYLKTPKPRGIQFMFYTTFLVMLGLVFAGTGFSRYWLIFLPCYYLGYYYVFKGLKLKDNWFFLLSKIVAIVYVINEIRTDYLIFDKHF